MTQSSSYRPNVTRAGANPTAQSKTFYGGQNNNTSSGWTINTPSVSDFLNYGSYSGADITVYIHTPRSLAAERAMRGKLEDINSRIENKQAEYNSLENNSRNIERQNALYNEIISLFKELEEATEQYEALITMPTTIPLGEIQTISWSTFREKSPVRTLGSIYPKGYVRSGRTIAGSMIFTIFNKHALHELLERNMTFYSTGTVDYDKYQYTSMLPDQLPPLDISLIFANEYGAMSHMGLYGVEFVQEGATFSIEDIFSENVVQYVARDMDPISLVGAIEHGRKGPEGEWTTTATNLMATKEDELGHLKRRNPFI